MLDAFTSESCLGVPFYYLVEAVQWSMFKEMGKLVRALHAQSDPIRFYSTLFTVPKKGGSRCPIINLRLDDKTRSEGCLFFSPSTLMASLENLLRGKINERKRTNLKHPRLLLPMTKINVNQCTPYSLSCWACHFKILWIDR